ncbi:hypothetical protein F5X99DRAFT_428743 [Biscogniauxia marginata]|nr:hypothetical protein F5X99DRAFT_428743 [Biscogniauxia marginata]
MRIACLQFAPQVGDIDNNLNRADAVLSKANPEDLDLLVLPELAFTGYNFKSLQQISPFLEPQGSGISALWARTIALKHNCVVTVGYPEKVDVKPKWPTSPEYYNSVIVVNSEGETIANYRKSFLYYTDETWALEGQEGFYEGYIPGLGHTSMGICMDINPYKFEAPWHAFEFAFHILEVESNLVIVTMAWLTREDGRMFSRMPKEPDMDTLTYWITRLEPLIRSENEEEIVVVFCNRTGIEDDAVYAGTSAVIGIKDGEVSVYGILGRGDKELLVVDTKAAPYAKLVYRPDDEGSLVASVNGADTTSQDPDRKDGPEKSPGSQPSGKTGSNDTPIVQSPKNIGASESSKPSVQPSSPMSQRSHSSQRSHASQGSLSSQRSHSSQKAASSRGITKDYDYVPLGRRSRAGSDRSTRSIQGSVVSGHSTGSRASKDSQRSKSSSRSRASKNSTSSTGSSARRESSRREKPKSPPIKIPPPRTETDTIPTPTGPSPTPLAIRPKLVIPKDAHKRPPVPHVPTPYPSAGSRYYDTRIYGGQLSIQQQNDILTPTTAFDDMTPQSPNRFFWIPSDTLLKTPMEPRIWTPALADSPTLSMRTPSASQAYVKNITTVRTEPIVPQSEERPSSTPPKSRSTSKSRVDYETSASDNSKPTSDDDLVPVRPSSPKSRNASRSRDHDRSNSALGNRPDLTEIAQRLEALSPRPNSAAAQRIETFSPRPGSALDHRNGAQETASGDMPERPSSPKSRNASRSRSTQPTFTEDPLGDQRHSNDSRTSIPIVASPSILDKQITRGPSAMYRPDSRMSNVEPTFRPMSRVAHSRSNSVTLGYMTQAPIIPEAVWNRPQSRAASRGRQRAPKGSIEASGLQSGSTQINPRDSSTPTRRPSAPSFGFRSPAEFEAEIKRISPAWSNPGGSAGSGDENEIIGEIIVRRSPSCAIHGDRRPHNSNQGQEVHLDIEDKEKQEDKPPQGPVAPTLPKTEQNRVHATAEVSTQTLDEDTQPSPNAYAPSVEVLASLKNSLSTPLSTFNPTTPKAMVFVRDDDASIPTTPMSAPFLKHFKVAKFIEQKATGNAIMRPKSAVW